MAEPLKFNCLVTDEGLKKVREVSLNPGWRIEPTIYKLSSTHGDFIEERTYDSMEPVWYSSPLSGAYPVDEKRSGQIIFSVVIPPNAQILDTKIEEIYFICKDRNGEEFLYGIAQPNQDLYFTPGVTQSYAFVFTINNINVENTYIMNYTFPQDIDDHNHDPLAHDEILTRVLNKTQVSNCILEAPNGVLEYDEESNSITIKSGIKHLIPNGRLDNKTLNNIESVQSQDVITILDSISDGDYFLFKDLIGNCLLYSTNNFYIQDNQPLETNVLWYSHKINLFNFVDVDNNVNNVHLTLVGQAKFLNNKITEIKTYEPLELVKRSDLRPFTATPLAFYAPISVPSNTNISCNVDGIFYSIDGSVPLLDIKVINNGVNHQLMLYSYTCQIQKGMILKSTKSGIIVPYIGQ